MAAPIPFGPPFWTTDLTDPIRYSPPRWASSMKTRICRQKLTNYGQWRVKKTLLCNCRGCSITLCISRNTMQVPQHCNYPNFVRVPKIFIIQIRQTCPSSRTTHAYPNIVHLPYSRASLKLHNCYIPCKFLSWLVCTPPD